METNKCIKCGIEKPVSEFSKHCKTIKGIRNSCKSCESIRRREWKKNNPEKVKAGRKRYRLKNAEKIKEDALKWRLNFSKTRKENGSDIKVCRTCKIEKRLFEFYASSGGNCKECEKARMKEYRENHPIKRKETKDKWNANNPDWIKQNKKNYVKRRIKRDPVYRAMKIMRARTTEYANRKFHDKRGKFSEIIGIDPDGLREYISSKFKEGMSWENYGWSTWHLDHIIPISSAKSIKELEELSHYTNLQPLWKDENLDKSNKIL